MRMVKLKLTATEALIVRAVNSRPESWLNCHGEYIGEVLALQTKGYLESRLVNGQLQVKTRG